MTSTSRRGWRGERRDAPSFSEVLHVLRERRLLVAGVVLVLAGAALLVGLYRGPVYVAEATVSLEPQEELADDEAREAFLREVQVAVASDEMLREVMRRADWGHGIGAFRERLDVRPSTTGGGEPGLRVGFSSPEPEQAARAANAYAELFADRVERLDEERLAGGTQIADARVERRAVTPPPRGGADGRPFLYAAAAAGAGLLLGGAAAMLLEGRTRGWRGVHDAEMTLRVPVLGAIPDYGTVPDQQPDGGVEGRV